MAALSQIVKRAGTFVVSYFDSSEGIKKHHSSCHAVMHDRLPDEPSMRALLRKVGLKITVFIDQAGFYCIIAVK